MHSVVGYQTRCRSAAPERGNSSARRNARRPPVAARMRLQVRPPLLACDVTRTCQMMRIVNILLRRNYDVTARHGHVSTNTAVAVKLMLLLLLLLLMLVMREDVSLCGCVIIMMIFCNEWRHICRVRLHTMIVQHSGVVIAFSNCTEQNNNEHNYSVSSLCRIL